MIKFTKTALFFLSLQLAGSFIFPFLSNDIAFAKNNEGTNISRQAYPRAFFFRKSEGDAIKISRGKISYKSWSDSYQRLGGIMGKALEEEIPKRSANLAIFNKFKKNNPNQLLLLHYNGNSRDPRDASDAYFSGHWIYYNGTTTTRDLLATAGESDIHVNDTSVFETQIGRYKNKNDDIGICLIDSSGKPNWDVSEQVQLLSINHKNQTIRVRRGSYNTIPLYFPAGKTYIAAHVTKGPYGKHSNLLWNYNFSTHSPRNADGLTSFEVLAEDLAAQFSPKGNLTAFDGIEFDVMTHHRGVGNKRSSKRGLDMDADGRADWGFFDGVNTYGLGVIELVTKLREKLGENFIILADGTNTNSQRGFHWINGIESEGWPNLRDSEINGWSSGMNRHRYWAAFGRKPAFNYINHKFLNSEGKQIRDARIIPYSTHRLIMGAAQLFDAFFTYSSLAPKDDVYLIGVYDELRKGKDNEYGWLGFPKGDPINLAKEKRNLLVGKTPDKLKWQSIKSTINHAGNMVEIEGHNSEPFMQFFLKDLPANERDLTVAITMRASPPKGYSKHVPRLAWIGLADEEYSLINDNIPKTGMKVRGQLEQSIDSAVTDNIRFMPNRSIANEVHNAYFTHPPKRGKAGYTFWQRPVEIPQDALLTFYTGLSRRAKIKSDGVSYKVLLKEGKKDFVVIFDQNITEWKWQKHSISLAPWANKRVILKFIADSGPQNNSVADHAYWGDAYIQTSLNTVKYTPQTKYSTFVGDKSFESTFYFRNVQTSTIDLVFKIEGAGRVWIEDVDVYPSPEVFIREFDNGLVLVNPSDQDYLFNLKQLVGKTNYKKMTASETQDININDGSKITGPVLVGPKDSLFLIQEKLVP